ncbi:MAG: quinoprotein relay system zinc metallohydrolase 2 [Methylophagaceae bacterium]
MHRIAIHIVGLTALFFITSSYGCEDYPIKEVTSGIYYHQGVHEEPAESNLGAISNVSFVIGDRCVAVIDSGGSYIEGTYLRKAIKEKTDLPVCYVINTHVHPDHIFGNGAFKDDKPEFVGHEKLPASLAARQPYFARVYGETLGSAYEGVEFIAPTMTVSKENPVTIDLGNRQLVLTAHPTSHTDHDLTVFDNNTKTLWTGDLLFMGRIPAMDGSINGVINTVEKLQAMDVNYIIPGHGTASSDLWQQGLANQLRYFNVLRDGIRAIIADFGTIDQASKQVGWEEEANWELFNQYHRRNVTSSFVQLEWE